MKRMSCLRQWFAILALACLPGTALAVGWGPTDFIIADFGGGHLAVYDQSLVFKGYLDASFATAAGLDFVPGGNLVATGQGNQFRQYTPAGGVVTNVTNPAVGAPADSKVGPGNLVYVGTQTTLNAVREFTLAGAPLRTFGNLDYVAVAILPTGSLWAGGNDQTGFIDVFNIGTGLLTSTLPLDHAQSVASVMSYSAATNTILTTDSGTGNAFERGLAGNWIRTFSGLGITQTYGITRGPGGDIYATDFNNSRILHWLANGTFVGPISISANVTGPFNIVWAGNSQVAAAAPVPGLSPLAIAVLGLLLLGVTCVMLRRQQIALRKSRRNRQ